MRLPLWLGTMTSEPALTSPHALTTDISLVGQNYSKYAFIALFVILLGPLRPVLLHFVGQAWDWLTSGGELTTLTEEEERELF